MPSLFHCNHPSPEDHEKNPLESDRRVQSRPLGGHSPPQKQAHSQEGRESPSLWSRLAPPHPVAMGSRCDSLWTSWTGPEVPISISSRERRPW